MEWLILAVIALWAAGAVYWMRRRKKLGKGCCGGCSGCSMQGSCHSKKTD